MQTVLAWCLVGGLLLAAYPSAAWLLRRESQPTLTLLLTLALGTGALSLVMFWEALLGIPFGVATITLPYLALMLPAFVWWMRQPKRLTLKLPELPRIALLILCLIGAAVLFNAAYFPFYRDDTLGIYQPQAQQMFQLGGLIPLTGADSLYLTYPPHMQLIYTFTYVASGWENDYLARVIPALLALGCLPATYLLGRRIAAGSSAAGWLGALTLALTPTFGKWASSGYVDLPMAFFYALAAIFAFRLWDNRRASDALLLGALIGLAAWTKNAALTVGVPVLGVWLAWCLIRRRIVLRHALISLAACAAICAAWYIRNQIGAGFLIPATAWTEQARRTLESLLIFVTLPDNFAVSGWLILISLLLSGVAVVHQFAHRNLDAPELLLILVWTLPFFAAWWLFVSYDPRFLLLILPPLCALVGVWLARVWTLVPTGWKPHVRLALTVLALIFALYITYSSVDYKDDILRDPFMTHEQKEALVLTR